jgi:hypothetical protein
MVVRSFVCLAAAVLLPGLLHAQAGSSLRELSTDRPDRTESPYTVDRGHVQVELDLANYTRDRVASAGSDVLVSSYGLVPMNLKIGVLDRMDLQFVIESFASERETDRTAGTERTRRGLGDLTGRVKLNIWGNDGGTTAFGIMPFVTLSRAGAGASRRASGGVILPLAVALPAGWELGTMVELDLEANAGPGHHAVVVNSLTLGHALPGGLHGYAELFSAASTESGASWVGTVDGGLTYGIGENVQLDAGANVGISAAAEGVNPFVGLSFRL